MHHNDVGLSGEGEQCTYRACEEGGYSEPLLTLHARGNIKVSRAGSLFIYISGDDDVVTFEGVAMIFPSNRGFGE
jgi:hypothetical protein